MKKERFVKKKEDVKPPSGQMLICVLFVTVYSIYSVYIGRMDFKDLIILILIPFPLAAIYAFTFERKPYYIKEEVA